jgi:preprotein translocase subunit SecB
MGDPLDVGSHVNQTSFEYTSTKSMFTLNIEGKVEMVVTFLSPVIPDDLMRSSLPQSYMDVDVHSTDGNEHTVQLYTDISAGESASVYCIFLTDIQQRMGLGRPGCHRRMVIRCLLG